MWTILGLVVTISDARAQTPQPAALIGASSPALSVSAVSSPLRIPPQANFGEVVAVALDARNHLFVFNRGPRPLMEFGANGRYVRELAQGLITRAHSVRVDRTGHIWLVDDTDHHVIRLDTAGRVVMVLGRRGRVGDTEDLFNRPTDVAVNSRGEIFVADGYGNSRIVKFSREGEFLLDWGTKGNGPGQFNIPHAIVVDSLDRLYVADRENHRVQVFDSNGGFLAQWPGFEYPQGLFLGADQTIYVGDASRVVRLDASGRVLGILGSYGRASGQFIGLHGLAVGTDGTLFTAELINWRVQKFVPRRR